MTENLSARLEYDYLDFGTKNYTFANLSAPGGSAVQHAVCRCPVSMKSSCTMITVGINYRFNWGGGGAVVTK